MLKNKNIVLIMLLVPAILSCGCVSDTSPSPTPVPDSILRSAESIADIDAALNDGPVFLLFGAEWCDYCKLQKPIIQDLSNEYESITFFYADTEKSPDLARAFFVGGIPQSNIIVKKSAEGYTYIDSKGSVTDNGSRSRIVGLRSKPEIKPLLNASLDAREK